MKAYYSWDDVNGMMADITQQMATKMLKPHVVLGPGRGGFPIGVMMSHYFDIPFHGFEWQTRDGEVQNSNQLRQLLSKYNGKRVVIIDDINDTGETFNYIKNNFGGEDKVRTASIIHNTPSNFKDLDYYCYEIDKRVVPCGIVFPWEEW